MIDFIKTFGVAILLFVVMGYATLSHACGEMEEPAPMPTINIGL